MFVETSVSRGKGGRLTLTGNLGDVMKESAMLALEYIKAHAAFLNINPDIFELSPRGTVTCSDDGVTSFSESDGGLHRYLKFHEEDDSKQNVVNAIVKSSSDKRERVKYKGSASHRN